MYIPQSKYQSNLEKGEKISTLAVNVLTLSGFFSLGFGTLITYGYLDNIEQTAIFPDILTSPSSLLALISIFAIYFAILIISLISPYLIVKRIDNHKISLVGKIYDLSNHYNNLILTSVLAFIAGILPIFISNEIYLHISILLTSILLYCYRYFSLKKDRIKYKIFYFLSKGFWLKQHSKKKIIKSILELFVISGFLIYYCCFQGKFIFTYFWVVILNLLVNISLCISAERKLADKVDSYFYIIGLPIVFSISTFLFLLIVIQVTTNNYQDDIALWILLLLIISWIVVYSINARIAFSLSKRETDMNLISFLMPIILLFLMGYFLLLFDRNRELSRLILKPLHFIEYPSNANWYTIDTRFFAPNNLTIGELESNSNDLKQYFNYKTIQDTGLQRTLLDSQCQFLSNKTRKEQCEQKENQFKNERKYNRFYGYVAWNLGDMKVFCPHGYEQARLVAQKEKKINPIKCLALKSEYIIPYY